MVLTEKDRSIERLENDLLKAGQREEGLKQMHNNYMLQVQSLINPELSRLQDPQGMKRNKRKISLHKKEAKPYNSVVQYKPASKESPDIGPEKGHIEKICKCCKKPFYSDNIQKEYCSKEHKDEAYNEKGRREREYRKKENMGE